MGVYKRNSFPNTRKNFGCGFVDFQFCDLPTSIKLNRELPIFQCLIVKMLSILIVDEKIQIFPILIIVNCFPLGRRFAFNFFAILFPSLNRSNRGQVKRSDLVQCFNPKQTGSTLSGHYQLRRRQRKTNLSRIHLLKYFIFVTFVIDFHRVFPVKITLTILINQHAYITYFPLNIELLLLIYDKRRCL